MYSNKYSHKKLLEIPEEKVKEVFARDFIVAFDKVNRRERYGTSSIEYYREIDIITKRNNTSYVVLASITNNNDTITQNTAQVYFNENILSYYQIDIPKLKRTVDICKIVERALNNMRAHRVYEEYYKGCYSTQEEKEKKDLIENAREILVTELFSYTENLQKEYEEMAANKKKRWWNSF